MKSIFALAILVLDIIAILNVVKSPKDTVKKALWIAIILILPLIGMIAYFLMGREKA